MTTNRFGIFTKPIHIEKLVRFLNDTDIDYFISTSKEETYLNDFDIGVSYCFPWIVDINYPVPDERVWYNYHPAPLPEYPGISNYVSAINDGIMEYGVTLHQMNKHIDSGNIIKKRMFQLESIPISTNELGVITHYYLFQLFKNTVMCLDDKPTVEFD